MIFFLAHIIFLFVTLHPKLKMVDIPQSRGPAIP